MISYQGAADAVTYARVLVSGAVDGSLITAPEDDLYSWGRAVANGVACAADAGDGWLARKDPNGPSNPDLDQEWDKITSYATEGTIAVKHHDAFAATSVLVDAVRDTIVNRKRQEIREINQEFAHSPDFTPIEVKARPLGKVKAWGKGITNTLALSPLGEKYPKTVRAMRVGCMILTVASGVEFVNSANKAIDQAYLG